MKRKFFILAGLILVLGAIAVTIGLAAGQNDLRAVKEATAQFQRTEAAEAAGYTLVPGLDYCFINPTIGGMGFHYIQTASLDITLDALQPEAMVYWPDRDGRLQLGAVEYIVPADAWHAAGNTEPPIVLDQSLHLNESLGVYVLHAWIWKNNPAGVFEDWNPNVSCP
jgi:hypothetical protein